jgi:hypothetical protein
MEKFIRGISPEYNFLKFSIFPFFHFLDIRERSVTHHMAAPTNLWLVTTPKNGKMDNSTLTHVGRDNQSISKFGENRSGYLVKPEPFLTQKWTHLFGTLIFHCDSVSHLDMSSFISDFVERTQPLDRPACITHTFLSTLKGLWMTLRRLSMHATPSRRAAPLVPPTSSRQHPCFSHDASRNVMSFTHYHDNGK